MTATAAGAADPTPTSMLEPPMERLPLTKAAARKLTDRIATATGMLWTMIAEAHERQAWRALGYDTWAAYVDTEFQISRGQAFRLLDQARVVRALEEAGVADPPVSARQAAVLRDEPAKAAKRVAKAVDRGKPVGEAVAGEVARVRSARTSKPGASEGGDPTGTPTRPGARGGAVAATGKAAEAPTAAPTPRPTSSTPTAAGEPAPPAPPAPLGSTPDSVRNMVAMVTTVGADTIAHCCEDRAIATAIHTLQTALRKRPKRAPLPTNKAAARSTDVTPIPKGGKR